MAEVFTTWRGGTPRGPGGRLPRVCLALLSATLVLAGCGSEQATGSSDSASSAGATGSAGAIILSTSDDGTHLVDGAGRAVYLWEADTAGTSTCTGACVAAWPPVVSVGAPRATGGAAQSEVGTVEREDGAEQVTYAGHPLYYYAEDTGSATEGQGSDGFGALWWLVAPGGSADKSAGSGGDGGSGGGYGY